MANITSVVVPSEATYDMPDGSTEWESVGAAKAAHAWSKANNAEITQINRKLDLILNALGVGET